MRPFPSITRTLAALLTAALAFVATQASAAETPAPLDRSMSPYFVVKGGAEGTDTMPLESTRADVQISGTIAHVKVTQVYKNTGDDVLEAIYVFPGSTRAAVFGMRMTVGERTIVAQIQKKAEARKIYEAAKRAGKSASLLEQKRPNVFQMNVANILPGDTITVEMDYTELLVPTEGVYEFVYPAVVGPRYTGESDSGEPWTAQPFTEKGVAASYGWDIDVDLNAGMPIQRVYSTSHILGTKLSEGRDHATITLPLKGAAGTKDFVLRYQLAGKAIQSGLLLYPGERESFFLAMIQPPEEVTKRQMPKREYIFILDVSGSMHGFPLDTAKRVMDELFKGLSRRDRFNIMYFSGGSKLMSERSLPATKANLDKAHAMLKSARGGGGTRILGALERALKLPTPDDYARTFVVVTDGYVSVEPKVFELIRANLDQANLFAFGIGSSVNRHLIEGMARVGMGEPFFVMHGDDATEKAAKFAKYIKAPALTNVKLRFDGFDAYDVEPSAVPDLFASRPVIVFGKYRGAARGKIALTGLTGAGPYRASLDVASYAPSQDNEALRYLWARHRIAALADLNSLRHDDARVREVTELGLKYNLMTAYTSFIAVDERVRNQSGESTTVKQPLPLPAGVDNTALGQPASGLAFSGAGMGGGGIGYGGAKRGGRMLRTRRPSLAPPTGSLAPPLTSSLSDDMVEVKEAEEGGRSGQPPHAPKIIARLIGTTVVGAHAEGVVNAVLKRALARLATCGRRVGETGTLIVTLSIDARGRVIATKAGRSSVGAEAARCIDRRLRRLKFPNVTSSSEGPSVTTVRVVLKLSR